MDELRTPPAASSAARHFNLAVAALGFLLMLAFAVWLVVTAADGNGALNVFRAVAGILIFAAAATFLRAVADEWRSGEPFQQSRTTLVGIALFGIGTTVLAIG